MLPRKGEGAEERNKKAKEIFSTALREVRQSQILN